MTRAIAVGLLGMAMDLGLVLGARAQELEPGEPIDFALEETSGQTRTMREVRGRVVVIFYEDREHTDVNRDLKYTLHRFVIDNQLRDRMTTYAVANVSSIGDGIVRDMARSVIRAIAERHGIQLLLDWDGALQRPPLSMRDEDANVAIVDREGRVRWRHRGAMGDDERRSFFRTLRQLLREPLRAP